MALTTAPTLGAPPVLAYPSSLPSSAAALSLPPGSHRIEPTSSYVAEAAPPREPSASSSDYLNGQPLPPPPSTMWFPPTEIETGDPMISASGDDNLSAWDRFLGEEEEEPPTLPPDLDLEAFSEEELYKILEEREAAIAELQEEMDSIHKAPGHFEARLAKLEQIFGHVTPGDIIQVEAPVLSTLHHALQRDHLLSHDEALGQKEVHGNKAGLHRNGKHFPLGRGYLPIDQYELAAEKAHEDLKNNHHPQMQRMHYAGHVAAESHVTDAVFVCAGGAEERRPLYPRGYRFWLHGIGANGGRGSGWQSSWQSPASQQPDARFPEGYSPEDFVESVHGPDAQAVDWLGEMKRGHPVPKPHPKDPWQPPDWMY
mmetsp:Transcript_41357/g.74838  ORF Transcript_41357/g.74838 Transcript_41357/m.74838 type:complete len:370 (+) Transcript_41357:84-1193(+)